MWETRRRFLVTLAATASCAAAADGLAFAQVRNDKPFPTPPASAETQNPAEAAAAKSDPQSAKRAALQQHEKEFRAEVDRLYQLAGELKQEVDKTVTTDVFSVQMYRRTEEIEKVAKMLKSKAKG
jgi:flagellar motility protein MotE (MotC chaperone)